MCILYKQDGPEMCHLPFDLKKNPTTTIYVIIAVKTGTTVNCRLSSFLHSSICWLYPTTGDLSVKEWKKRSSLNGFFGWGDCWPIRELTSLSLSLSLTKADCEIRMRSLQGMTSLYNQAVSLYNTTAYLSVMGLLTSRASARISTLHVQAAFPHICCRTEILQSFIYSFFENKPWLVACVLCSAIVM